MEKIELARRALAHFDTKGTDQAASTLELPVTLYGDVERFQREKQAIFMELPLALAMSIEPETTMGPLIDQNALAKVKSHIEDALEKGARIVTGGKPHALAGTFFEPTVMVDVPVNAIAAKEETFGPLAPVFRFHHEEEAIAYANDTEYGLAAYFYTRDISRVFRVAEALEYGMVGINSGAISTEVAPFGGVKASGLGREGSKYGIEEYIEIKYLSLDI